MSDDRLKIAVFIDFDNIEIGVKTTLNSYFDIGSVLEAIKERGEIVTKIAYGDWTRAGDYGRSLSQHAVHMVQRNLTPGGDKNGADINLALDALEMAFTHSHINTFVIVSGDSDFISLVEKLKQYDRKVFVVGGRAFTSVVMQKNCTEFMAYENIVGRGRSSDRSRPVSESSLGQAMPLIRRALKLLADREVLPQLGLLKSTLLQLDSAFSEREYGASSFRDFIQKLAKAGHVALKGSERSFHVELREGLEGAAPAAPAASTPVAAPVNGSGGTAGDEPGVEPGVPGAPRPEPMEGVRLVQQTIAGAANARWPLYVRQVKQLVRAADSEFDERRYGFGSLVELLKLCQREGVLRLERDRQGIVRVWPPGQVQRGTRAAAADDRPAATDAVTDVAAIAAGDPESMERSEPLEDASMLAETIPVPMLDTVSAESGYAEEPSPAESTDDEEETGDVNGNVAEPAATAAEARRRTTRRPAARARKTTGTSRRPAMNRTRRAKKSETS
ncbi:MAG: NYN domain-containing protein [Vicinamibacterales bacterium]